MQEPHWLGLQRTACAITGAAHGIGLGIAQGLAAAGARVALLDRDGPACEAAAASLRTQGAEAIAIPCDTASPDSMQEAAQAVEARFGACTGLVNNAGIMPPGTLAALDLDDWNRVLAVNLTGYLIAARAFRTQMCAAGGGSMVHVASISGSFPQTRSGAYSASKAGVRLLSRQIAVEWGSDNIRSNTVCPGMIRTPLSAAFYADEDLKARRAAMTASRRIGEVEDIANAALFLLSARSSYINAADIDVTGGMEAMLMDRVPRPGYNQAKQGEAS